MHSPSDLVLGPAGQGKTTTDVPVVVCDPQSGLGLDRLGGARVTPPPAGKVFFDPFLPVGSAGSRPDEVI